MECLPHPLQALLAQGDEMNETLVLQILVIGAIIFIYSRVILRLRDGQISTSEFLFWSLLWGAVVFVVLVPTVLSSISQIVGIGRGLDLVLPVALILAFYLIFRAYVKIEQVEQDLTTVVRGIALRELDKRKRR